MSIHSSSIRSSRQDQRGAALIESLIAVLLFSLGVLGLIGLQTRAIGMASESDDRNRAALLADGAVTSMWQNASVTLTSADLTQWQKDVADRLPNGSGTITAVSSMSRTADILITWRPPTRGQSDTNQLSTRVTLTGPDF
ncbi:fimbrial assembly protein [Diaphorobacter sp. HDW4A]|uniref:type IV pilus modification PilV family protein n=1 Tax=Diaphorobacter sp. HDW4A TaxID=2714924 RepID=UPI00140E4CDE|nr:fimbrial assembly protein [Diaphorobacter sp. HDW4A]QIL78594.1 fimbrial assembly protein [Diaphorobacter sp. HDW4A]